MQHLISYKIFIDNNNNLVNDILVNRNTVSGIRGTIRQQRLKKDLSQAELAQKVGMTQAQIARIERERNDVRLSTLTEVARALGLEPILVPKSILPAIRHLLAQQQGEEAKSSPEPRRLFGSEPEDANDENSK